MPDIPHLGEIFALAAPISWSVAVILFRKSGEHVPALALNVFKNVLAMLLFLATLFAVGQSLLRPVPARDYLLLLLSGAIGIGISDTFFFMTLNRVGAGLQAIINTSYSPSIIFLSVLFLGERLNGAQIGGVLLILGAVMAVSWIRDPAGGLPPRRLAVGITFGLLTTTTQAVSIVMIKPLLEESPLLWANVWRLMGGLIVAGLLSGLWPRQRRTLHALRNRKAWKVMVPGAIVGTYVALIFWLAGMKYAMASIAAVLNQTSTLWIFLLAALLLHEPVTPKRLLGLLLGLGGVALVTFG